MIQYLVSLACPNCQHKLRIKHEYLGRTLRCKYCAHEFPSPTPDQDSPRQLTGQQETEGDAQASQQRIAVLEAELQAVREELEGRAAQHTAAVEKFTSAQAEIEQLQAQLQVHAAPKATRAPLGRENTPLLEKAQNIRAQLEARVAIQEQLDRLNAELGAARAEQNRLTAELQTMAAEANELRGKGLELERSVTQWTRAHADLSQALQQGQAQWEGERQVLHRDWEEKFQAQFRAAEQRLVEEKTRGDADQRQLQEQLDALRRTHEQQTASLQSEVDRVEQEIAALRQEHDASVQQVQLLGEEREQIAAERDELDSRYKEAVERFRADFARLTEAWQQSRQQETAAAERKRALSEKLEALNAELAQQHNRETEQQQLIATLQQTVATLHAEAMAEHDCHNKVISEERSRVEAERQKRQEESEAAERRFEEENNALRSEVEHLRGEIAVFQQALEIVGVVGG